MHQRRSGSRRLSAVREGANVCLKAGAGLSPPRPSASLPTLTPLMSQASGTMQGHAGFRRHSTPRQRAVTDRQMDRCTTYAKCSFCLNKYTESRLQGETSGADATRKLLPYTAHKCSNIFFLLRLATSSSSSSSLSLPCGSQTPWLKASTGHQRTQAKPAYFIHQPDWFEAELKQNAQY